MGAIQIGIVGFENANALDIAGPAEAFASAVELDGSGKVRPCYEVTVVGLTSRPFVTESGLVFQPTATFARSRKFDTLIVPGGFGARDPKTVAAISKWLTPRTPVTRRIASVCTGIYALAATGLLDGRKVTTHWRFAGDVAKKFSALAMNPNALFVKDGKFYSSAGVTAGIDLALALIEEDFGPKIALAAARDMVVYFKRSGGQEQYSEPLRFQTSCNDRFADLITWMNSHPTAEMSVESLARRASLSPRHFFRRFKEQLGVSPALFVETLRLNEARRRLATPEVSIEAVAESVGFTGADSFRRAFHRRFRVTPSKYRRNFSLNAPLSPNESSTMRSKRRTT